MSKFDDKITSLKELLPRVPDVGGQAKDIFETSTLKLSKYYEKLTDKMMQSEQFNSICESGKIVVSLPREYLEQFLSPVNKINEASEEEHLEKAIVELQKKDKVGVAGEVIAATGGAVAGVATAGTIASAAGATTLLGSSTLASLGGGVFVVSTPLGWIVGSAVVAGAAGYGIAKLIRSGSEQDQERKSIVGRLNKRLNALEDKTTSNTVVEELRQLLPIAVASKLVTESQAERMLVLLDNNKLNPELALNRIKALEVKIQFHATNL